MKYTIKRSEWFRGQGYKNSRLLTQDSKRCCIGFVGQQCGITDNKMLNQKAVINVGNWDMWPAWFSRTFPSTSFYDYYDNNEPESGLYKEYKSSEDLNAAYKINDSVLITDEQRESQLKELFSKHGDELEFID